MLVMLVATGLSACAGNGSCGFTGCPADKQTTADVRALFAQHAELGAPGEFHIQTINGVVYLNGMVDSDMEKINAETIALRVPTVKSVVNNLSLRNSTR